MTIKRLGLVLLVLLSLMLTSCPDPVLDNRSPSIVSISTGGATATIGETKAITAMASDPDGDTIQYSWDATGGSFSATTGQNVNWTAPDSTGTVSLPLSISDGRNATVSKSVTITVTIPNSPVSSFVAESRPESSLLSWINPPTSNFASVLIRRSDSSYPLEPTEGTEIYRGSNQSFLDTGLDEGSQYYYSAWAINNSLAYSTRVTATATPTLVDTTAPFDVTSLSASPGDSTISLAWNPPSNEDYDYSEISFTPVQSGISQPIKTQRGVNGYNASGLTNTVEYSFLVRSVYTSGNKSLGSTITGRPEGTMNQDDQTPPTNVASLQTEQGENEITLSWLAPPESDYAFAEISFLPTQVGVPQPVVIPRGSTSTTIRPLRGGQVFTFTVKSVDFSSNRSGGTSASDLVLDSTPPGDPQSLRFTPTGSGTGTLTWSNPADFDYMTSSFSSDLSITGWPRSYAGTSISLTGLLGLPYTTTVKSVDFSGNQSPGVAVTFTPMDTTPPANLVNFACVPNPAGSRIGLNWSQPSDHDFQQVEITFTPEASGVTQPIIVAKGTTTTSIDGLVNGTYYQFTLKTVDVAGNKSSGTLNGATPSDPPPPDVTSLSVTSDPFGEQVNCSWTEPTVADFSHVELTFTPTVPGIEQPIILPKGTTSYSQADLSNGTAYTFTFKSVDLNGNKSTGISRTATPSDAPPPDVTDLTATPDLDGGIIHLSWTEPTVLDFSHIELLFSPAVSGITQPISLPKGTTSYSQTGLADGTGYTFIFKSVDLAGNFSTGISISRTPSNPTPSPVGQSWFSLETSGGAAAINWIEPSSGDFTHVKISFTPEAAGINQPVRVNKGTTSTRLTGLENGVLYTFSLVACDATEAESSAMKRSIVPWDCSGGSYAIGSVGQAGGYIFHDKGETSEGWRYLEAWNADEPGSYLWKTSNTLTGGTSTEIGSGYANNLCLSGTQHPAAYVCLNAEHGGYTDWFLPSRDELNQLTGQEAVIGAFVSNYYWSSSESSSMEAWAQFLGNLADINKNNSVCVRAIRAF